MNSQSTNISVIESIKKIIKKYNLNHQTFRRLVQLSFATFIIVTVLRHIVIGEDGPVITASAEAYCPFGGLETLYKYLTSGGAFVSHTHLSNVVLFIAVIVTAILLRSAFCGWICPLGSLQDMISGISKAIQKRLPKLKKGLKSIKQNVPWLSTMDRVLKFGKYFVLIWAIGGSAYFGYMVFRDYDPWSALINIAEFSFTPGLIVLFLTIVLSLFVERPWCRYACPLGAISGLAGKLNPVNLKREESACTLCQVCTKACPMGIEVHKAKTIQSVDCISCLECVGACPRKGALEIHIGYSGRKFKGGENAS
jgi:polyferredoxin